MTKKPKKKLKYFQLLLSKVIQRIERNTIYPYEKGGAPYVPLRAVKEMVRLRRKVSKAQRDYNKSKFFIFRQSSSKHSPFCKEYEVIAGSTNVKTFRTTYYECDANCPLRKNK